MRVLFQCSLMIMGVCMFSGVPCKAESYAYISLGGEKKIAIYQLNEKTGALTHLGDVELEGAPGCLEVDPQKKYLFASVRTAQKFKSFSIDPQTGKLKLISSIPDICFPLITAKVKLPSIDWENRVRSWKRFCRRFQPRKMHMRFYLTRKISLSLYRIPGLTRSTSFSGTKNRES